MIATGAIITIVGIVSTVLGIGIVVVRHPIAAMHAVRCVETSDDACVLLVVVVACDCGPLAQVRKMDLGIAESVASVILIGFSVDYCVHLAGAYVESGKSTREGRTQDALTAMGIR